MGNDSVTGTPCERCGAHKGGCSTLCITCYAKLMYPCPKCRRSTLSGRIIKKVITYQGVVIKCPECEGQGWIIRPYKRGEGAK